MRRQAYLILVICLCCLLVRCSGLCASATSVNSVTTTSILSRQTSTRLSGHRPAKTSTALYGQSQSQSQSVASTEYARINTSYVELLHRPLSVAAGFAGVMFATKNPFFTLRPLAAVPLVGFLGSIFNPTYAPSMYAGAFGALTTLPVSLHRPVQWFFMTVSIGTIHEIWERLAVFRDCGGRLGSSTATGLALLLLLSRLLSPTASAFDVQKAVQHTTHVVSVLEPAKVAQGSAIVFAAAAATILLRLNVNRALGSSGLQAKDARVSNTIFRSEFASAPVGASATIGLLASAVFSSMQLVYGGNRYTMTYCAPVLTGTFLGMRNVSHYSASKVWKVATQSVLSTMFILVLNTTPLGKIGGILGVSTVASTLIVDAMHRTVLRTTDRNTTL